MDQEESKMLMATHGYEIYWLVHCLGFSPWLVGGDLEGVSCDPCFFLSKWLVDVNPLEAGYSFGYDHNLSTRRIEDPSTFA